MLEIYIYIDTYICIYIKKILTTKVLISFILKYKSKGEVSHSARESFIRYIYVHTKRLDLHPITYGIPSLQHTVNGRLARPRYAQTPHGVVQYVQDTVVGAFSEALELSSLSPCPRPLAPHLLEVKTCLRQYILMIR